MADYPQYPQYPQQPQQPYQQPYGVPPVAPKKEGIAKYVVLAGGGCLMFLIFIGIAVFLIFKFTAGEVKVVNQQLEALRSGDVQLAYTYCSEGFKKNTNFQDFQGFVDGFPIMKNAKEFSAPNREVSGGVTTLKGNIHGMDGSKQQAEFQLIKEGMNWKIQFIKLDEGGPSAKERALEEAKEPVEEPQEETEPDESSQQDGGVLDIADINIEKQSSGGSYVVEIKFNVVGFESERSRGRYRHNLFQDIRVLDPDGKEIFTRERFATFNDSTPQAIDSVPFTNTLTIPGNFPDGTYSVYLTVHDVLGQDEVEAETSFDLP